MKDITKEQLEESMQRIKEFKQLIDEKGSKENMVNYLVSETSLSKEECEKAYDFYNGIKLP